jgi:hypothetical protein
MRHIETRRVGDRRSKCGKLNQKGVSNESCKYFFNFALAASYCVFPDPRFSFAKIGFNAAAHLA